MEEALPSPKNAIGDVPSDVPGITAFRVTKQAVHLVLTVAGDWEENRASTVAETERLCDLAEEFANGAAFSGRFPDRIGVLRLLAKHTPPDIVRQVLAERGVEIEADGGRDVCALCDRKNICEPDISMTDEGWACPSCFRAWRKRQETTPRSRGADKLVQKLSNKLVIPLVLAVASLFALFVLHQLRRLNQANSNIRMHIPSE